MQCTKLYNAVYVAQCESSTIGHRRHTLQCSNMLPIVELSHWAVQYVAQCESSTIGHRRALLMQCTLPSVRALQ